MGLFFFFLIRCTLLNGQNLWYKRSPRFILDVGSSKVAQQKYFNISRNPISLRNRISFENLLSLPSFYCTRFHKQDSHEHRSIGRLHTQPW